MKLMLGKLLVLLLFISCNEKNAYKNIEVFFGLQKSEQAILLSCIKCSCIIEELNELITQKDKQLGKFIFLGDTSCLQDFLWKGKVNHISQKKIDSFSTDFYNLLIYNQGKIRMLKTENARNIKTYIK